MIPWVKCKALSDKQIVSAIFIVVGSYRSSQQYILLLSPFLEKGNCWVCVPLERSGGHCPPHHKRAWWSPKSQKPSAGCSVENEQAFSSPTWSYCLHLQLDGGRGAPSFTCLPSALNQSLGGWSSSNGYCQCSVSSHRAAATKLYEVMK